MAEETTNEATPEAAPEGAPAATADEHTDTGGGSTPSPDTAADGRPAGSSPEPVPADAEPESQAAEAAEPAPDDAPAEGAATDELLAAAAEALTKAQADSKEWQDKYLRLHAEWDTYRRRTGEQREQEKIRAAEKLVTSLLPVIDDFERTIDYAASNGEAELLDGVKAVHAKLLDVLTKDGVVVIDPAGEAFDALEQQAVATVPDESVPDETVRDVYQRGYKLGTKVLRPAMVTVTTGGPKRPKEEPEA